MSDQNSKLQTDVINIAPVTMIPEQIEPEQAPVKRVMDLPTTMRMGTGPLDTSGEVLKSGFAPVTADFMAGEVAQAVASRCMNCVHYRPELWKPTMVNWAGSNIGRKKILDRMIYNLARSISDHEPDLEEITEATKQLATWGLCGAHTERTREVTVTHPEGGCPEGFDYYRHRDGAARRSSSHALDGIMRAAQGKT